MKKEIWKNVKGFVGYKVSNLGKVQSIDRKSKSIKTPDKIILGRILRPSDDGVGYLQVVMYKNGKPHSRKVHKVVALAFIKNVFSKETVNHKDGNKKNNCVSNLEWATRSENTKHKYTIGLDSNEGERHPSSKLTNELVLEIRKRFAGGETDRTTLSKEFNVTAGHIFAIVKRHTWKHI